MKPTETVYILAASSKDYADCHTLDYAESGVDHDDTFSFPTVLAKRDGEVIGFLATIPNKRFVAAGPLVVKGGRNPIVAMRLLEAYDRIMAHCGMKMYYFSVDASRADALSIDRLKELGMQHMETKGNYAWMKRELK